MATLRNQAQWQKLVNQQSSSGPSAAAFCRDRNIGYPSFMAWRKRLLASEAEQALQVTPSQFIELTPAYRACDAEPQDLSESATHTTSTENRYRPNPRPNLQETLKYHKNFAVKIALNWRGCAVGEDIARTMTVRLLNSPETADAFTGSAVVAARAIPSQECFPVTSRVGWP